MRPSATLFLLLGLCASGALAAQGDPGRASAAQLDSGRASAAQLDPGRASAARQLARTERALAATRQAARAPRAELAPGSAEARPFWGTLDRMTRALAVAEAGLRAGDSRYFAAIGEGSRALTELEVVWGRLRHQDPGVGARVAALSASYRRLRNGYGWEALRRRQGGALTPAEARSFRTLQRAESQVAEHLKPVQSKVAKAGDQAMAEQLRRLREQAQRIATAERTLEAYLMAGLLNDIVQGEWAASQHYVKKPYRATWRKAAPAVEKLATDPGIGFVFTADLSHAEAWSFDAPPADEAAAAGEEGAGTPATAGRIAAPAADDTPVDEVEMIEGEPRRTEGVALDPNAPAEPGTEETASPASGDAPAPGEPSPEAVSAAPAPAPTAPASAEPPAEAPPAATTADPAVDPATSGDAAPSVVEPNVGPEAEPSPPEPDVIAAPSASGGEGAVEVSPPADAPPSVDVPVADDPETAAPPSEPSAPQVEQPSDQPPDEADPLPIEPPTPPPPARG
jgi:hypothetical protein